VGFIQLCSHTVKRVKSFRKHFLNVFCFFKVAKWESIDVE
jgi:hypothetical protein